MAKKERITLGDIRVLEGKSKKTGKQYQISKLQLHPSVKIMVGKWDAKSKSYIDHREVNLKDFYGSAEITDAKEDLDRIFNASNASMTEEQYNEQLSRLEERNIKKNVRLVRDAE